MNKDTKEINLNKHNICNEGDFLKTTTRRLAWPTRRSACTTIQQTKTYVLKMALCSSAAPIAIVHYTMLHHTISGQNRTGHRLWRLYAASLDPQVPLPWQGGQPGAQPAGDLTCLQIIWLSAPLEGREDRMVVRRYLQEPPDAYGARGPLQEGHVHEGH